MNKDVFNLNWRGIDIEVSFYLSPWSKTIEKNYGVKLFHLELACKQALPITNTGYKSLYIYEPDLKPYESASAYILAMLDKASTAREWKKHEESSKQLSLF